MIPNPLQELVSDIGHSSNVQIQKLVGYISMPHFDLGFKQQSLNSLAHSYPEHAEKIRAAGQEVIDNPNDFDPVDDNDESQLRE